VDSRHRSTRRGRRLARRTFVGGGAIAVAGGAAFLAACGGDEDQAGDTGARSELVTATVQAATTKQPKPGGSVSAQLTAAPPTLDPYTQTSAITQWVAEFTFSKLVRFKAGVPEVIPTDFTMEPDLAQAMPEQPDPTTLTFKLKPAKFHPPVSRAVVAEDVRYAIDRYANFDKSVHRPLWSFVDRVEAPDAQTLIIRTKFPYADAIQQAGGAIGAFISPKEVAEAPDAPSRMVGSGAFVFKEYVTGISLSYTKNPDYYDKPLPYFDEFKWFVVSDRAKMVADFSARSMNFSWLLLADERDQLKRNRPDAKLDEMQYPADYIALRTDKPPFNDKRVRQALSMGINRKLIRDAITKGEGQPDQTVFVGQQEWARQVKDLGPAAKYWDHNPTEAKALLAAAGANNLSFDWTHADGTAYGQTYLDEATLTQAQWKEIGVTANDKQIPYAQFISTAYQGNFEGISHNSRAISYFMDYLSEWLFTSSSGQRGRLNLSWVNNPQLNQLLDKQRGQLNVSERKATIKEIEALVAEEQYYIPFSTITRTIFWDANIENFRPKTHFAGVYPLKSWREG
jgi:ABC-type transport system substrate-binding protein